MAEVSKVVEVEMADTTRAKDPEDEPQTMERRKRGYVPSPLR